MNYTPLYIKTDNSIMQSLIKVPDLIEYALKNNLKSLAITDCNLYGVMDFYMLSIKNNIKPIVGLELILEKETIVLYCMNLSGYQNLLKLNKIKTEREINFNDLLLYKDNLICLIPYEYEELYFKLNKIYNHCFRTYKSIQEKNNIKEPSLYMNETLCLSKSDIEYLKYLKNDKKYSDNYLHLKEEMDIYNDPNNNLIYDLCNLEIPLNQNLMPKFKNEKNFNSYEYLKKQCISGLKEKFGDKVSKQYQERLKYELEVINKMNFCDYFLIVADYVLYAKDNNIIVGPGRGSVVGSLVAYLLNITEVDPIKHNLMFERFLNEDRITMPDIDIDFEHIKRENVIDYCIKKYGELNVVPIITFGTMGVKQTLKETANILNIDEYLIENFIKNLDLNISLKENYKNKKVIDYIKINNLELLAKLSLKFEGLKHHVSIHAAGVVMSKDDLTNIIPVVNYNGKYISGIDMTYLENIGLLKMDFLAIKYLTIIHEMIDEINDTYNLDLKFNEIPNNDTLVLEIFKKGDTLGIFQFESDGMIEFLKKLKPDTFEDICDAMALYRPGPMQNIDKYIENKNNPQKIKYIVPVLEEILKPTNGILIYQEQIIEMAQKVANYSKKDADLLRKAMSKKKKEILINEEEKFIQGCLNNNINANQAKQIFALMLKFAEYGFNKAHSCGYSLVSYRMAFLKAHYKHIFMAKLLTMELNDKTKLKKYIYECKKNNINILKPSINESVNKFIKKGNDLLFPLSGIKDINNAIALKIIEERKNGLFKDIYDFIKRCDIKGNIIENLIKVGAFECFGVNQKTLIENIDLIINYGELIKDIDEEYALKPILKEHNEYEIKEKLKNEIAILGIYLSNHPTTEYKNKYKNIIDLNNLSNYFDKDINVIGYVDNKREIMTKKNEKMCFLNISDELATTDLVIFPKNYEKNPSINQGSVLLVNGKVEKRFEKNQIIVNEVKILD